MSLILDALKKMEQERQAKLGKRVDIRPDVLGNRPRKNKRIYPYATIAGIVLLLAIGIATGIVLKGSGHNSVVPKSDGEAEPPVPAPLPPVEATPPPLTPVPAIPDAPVSHPAPSIPIPGPEGYREVESSEQPQLSVSGIAWQDDRETRRAVVNGVLVAEGATISGARVKTIKEDRVIFSYGGGSFEVILSSALAEPDASTIPLNHQKE
jgi:general secretion pathway protein B